RCSRPPPRLPPGGLGPARAPAARRRGPGPRPPVLDRPVARRRGPGGAAGGPAALPAPAPPAPGRLRPGARPHAAPLRPGHVRAGGGDGAGGAARPGADRGRDGRVPGRDRRGLPADAGRDRARRLHGPARVPLLGAAPDGGGPVRRPGAGGRGAGAVPAGDRARPPAPGGVRGAVRGPAAARDLGPAGERADPRRDGGLPAGDGARGGPPARAAGGGGVAAGGGGGGTARSRFELGLGGQGLDRPVRTSPAGTRTAEDAARAIGCDVAQIVKSLVFTAGGRPVIALLSGVNRLDTGRLE